MANKQLVTIDKLSKKLIDPETNIADLLPPSMNMDRFVASAMTAVRRDKGLLECRPESLVEACVKCAQDGLLPDARAAVFLPFWDNKRKCKVVQYIPMVQGIIQRARELGDTFSVTANVVYENDELILDESDPSATTHKRPKLGEDRGEIVGAYAIFRDLDGRVIHREVMDRKEIEYTRGFSKASNSPAWKQWFGEMARKTVIRRGSKYVPMSDELRTVIEREDEYVELNPEPETSAKIDNPFEADAVITDQSDANDVIDVEHEEVVDEKDEGQAEERPTILDEIEKKLAAIKTTPRAVLDEAKSFYEDLEKHFEPVQKEARKIIEKHHARLKETAKEEEKEKAA